MAVVELRDTGELIGWPGNWRFTGRKEVSITVDNDSPYYDRVKALYLEIATELAESGG